jgi:hypothetical protein
MPSPSVRIGGVDVAPVGALAEDFGLPGRLLRLGDGVFLGELGLGRLAVKSDGGDLTMESAQVSTSVPSTATELDCRNSSGTAA